MLSVCHFNKCMNTLLTFANVPVDEHKNKAWYNLMKNDFTDKEFSKICNDICKTEFLFGRYPEPKLFYDRYNQYKEPDMIIEDEIKKIEQRREDIKRERQKIEESSRLWNEFLKERGYSSTVALIMAGKESYKDLRAEFYKRKGVKNEREYQTE